MRHFYFIFNCIPPRRFQLLRAPRLPPSPSPQISVRFPLTYPTHPPAVRFETRILHPNVNAYGRICSNMLSRDWADDGGPRVPDVLRMVYSLFSAPETENPVDSALALDFYTTMESFQVRGGPAGQGGFGCFGPPGELPGEGTIGKF